MEPHDFRQNLNNKEIYNTLRMPIEQKPTPENITRFYRIIYYPILQ